MYPYCPYFFNPLNSKLPGREGWKRVGWGEETVDESAFGEGSVPEGQRCVAPNKFLLSRLFFFGSFFNWGSTQIRPIDSLRRPLPTQYLKIDTRDHADLFVARLSPLGRRGDHLPPGTYPPKPAQQFLYDPSEANAAFRAKYETRGGGT